MNQFVFFLFFNKHNELKWFGKKNQFYISTTIKLIIQYLNIIIAFLFLKQFNIKKKIFIYIQVNKICLEIKRATF